MQNSVPDANKTDKKFLVAGGVIAALFAIIFGGVIVQKNMSDPDMAMLLPDRGSRWIRFPQPTDLFARKVENVIHVFRYKFNVKKAPPKAILSFRAMKHVGFFFDGELVYVSEKGVDNWKKLHRVDLSPLLTPGAHEIYFKVLNANGHPALMAFCSELKIKTDHNWQASVDGKRWAFATRADTIQPADLSRMFERADLSLIKRLNILIPIFFAVFTTSIIIKRLNRYMPFGFMPPTAGTFRTGIMLLWITLGVNNITKIPFDVGMDLHKHFQYILYVAENWRIPLPTEGVQMFESPLFYIISAVIYKILSNILSVENAIRGLRIVPLLCGLIQVELCYRSLRYVFPKREDLQIVGVLVGGLLPINLYMSQVIGTEALSGMLIGIVVVMTLRLIHNPTPPNREYFILMGFIWGLAILTKVTAIILFPPIIFFCIYAIVSGGSSQQKAVELIARRIVPVIAIAIIVSGWYYFRNWLAIGKLFVGGWDSSREILWWQDPGYRTPAQLVTFGEALFYPIFSGVNGFWDSLYSTLWMDGYLSGIGNYLRKPPWNYGYMFSCGWLSLVPSVAIGLGILKTLWRPQQSVPQGTLLAVCCLGVYIFALLYLFLNIPFFSITKATYTMGLIPCYAILGAAGFDILARRYFLKQIVYGLISCWAFSAYAGYFVVKI